jgi:hypothetical protein
MRICESVLVTSVVLLVSGVGRLYAAPLDSTLYTTYAMYEGSTTVGFTVCGSLPQSGGCYGGGTMGPFVKVGAMIEGNPSQNLTKGTVTRYLYVVDVGYGSQKNGAALYIYKRVDTITQSTDTINVTLFNTIILPLSGGSGTVVHMAANNGFLFVGTNHDELAVELKKSTLVFSQYGGGPSGVGVSAITSDPYGYVTTTWGTTTSSFGCVVTGPNGVGEQEGGGALLFMLNTIQAMVPAALP